MPTSKDSSPKGKWVKLSGKGGNPLPRSSGLTWEDSDFRNVVAGK